VYNYPKNATKAGSNVPHRVKADAGKNSHYLHIIVYRFTYVSLCITNSQKIVTFHYNVIKTV